ncbi:HAD-IC family P-type ATPase [Blastococcus atacamensis]|uniref:HAD-IC family P-type ATPase n=1 Tax=Blastococcus atacamensis TaxID=2070508 RepID=UPI0012FFE4A7|nr:HAD-IC family P-type ATPase [Blastococcus atacamensis]
MRANVFTFFNTLLAGLCVIAVMTGRWQNAVFGGVVVANAAIGIVQEMRAKRTLDRLAVLNAPRARVLRDGVECDVPVAAVVLDDLLLVTAGDQVPADGLVLTSSGLAVDESLLTGEADAVAKRPGDAVWSGAIVVSGQARVQAVAVGESSYAAGLAAEVRRFTVTYSELVASTNRVLRWIAIMLLVVGPAVLWSQFRTSENEGWREAVTGTVAAMVGMIPEGLVLLTTLAFMVATLTLARRQVLVQELPAVEGLARVDVVCLDKTGTLTYGDIRFHRLVLLDADSDPPTTSRPPSRAATSPTVEVHMSDTPFPFTGAGQTVAFASPYEKDGANVVTVTAWLPRADVGAIARWGRSWSGMAGSAGIRSWTSPGSSPPQNWWSGSHDRETACGSPQRREGGRDHGARGLGQHEGRRDGSAAR